MSTVKFVPSNGVKACCFELDESLSRAFTEFLQLDGVYVEAFEPHVIQKHSGGSRRVEGALTPVTEIDEKRASKLIGDFYIAKGFGLV